jgi:hypothetical protein
LSRSSLAGASEVAGPDPVDPGAGGLQESRVLGVVRALTIRLDAAGIRYCQFKSNWHLDHGLLGLTDLDVLIEPHAGSRLAAILGQSGYKSFSPPPGGDYPGVEDYLAMDPDTGRLVHLHLHHQLTTGEAHLKGHHFPWEELLLTTRRRDEDSGFYVSDPSAELLFFLTRNTLKISLRHRLRAALGQDRVRDGMTREFLWLRGRANTDRVIELGRSLLGETAGPALRDILASGPSLGRMLALRARAMPSLRLYRMYAPVDAWLQRRRRELESLQAKLGKRFPGLAGAVARTDPRGGVLIAFMGPDGAGKSRLTTEVTKWLRWKLDARVIYFGSGDGPVSLARLPLKLLLRVAAALKLWSPTGQAAAGADGDSVGAGPRREPRRPGFARAVWALVLAREKGQNLQRAWRLRDRGIVVVGDRYPQHQVMGFNDGPLLDGWSRSPSGLRRALATWEAQPYRWAEARPPQLVIKLRVSPEVAVVRKPGMRAEEIQRRLGALASLRYPAETRVVEVDADRPWEEVLLDCKRRVWEIL